MSDPVTVYIDASLLAEGAASGLDVASELGLVAIAVDDVADLPADLAGAWYLTGTHPEAGSARWSRTVVIGPRREPGRVAVTGLRTARDLRLALLELASEAAVD
ncbi:MAG TPA: hypothetical protein VIC63_04100 [Candidatus Limnocylindria bacterium]